MQGQQAQATSIMHRQQAKKIPRPRITDGGGVKG